MTDASISTNTSRRSVLDNLRIDVYLLRLDWHLEGSLPGAQRKTAIKGLKQELAGDPRVVGDALRDLGTPRVLAARHGDEGALRPQWCIGIVIAATALLVYWALFLAFTGGMLAAVESAALGSAESSFLFIPVEAFSSADAVGIGWAGGWAWLVVPAVITAIAFLTGARAWRALRR